MLERKSEINEGNIREEGMTTASVRRSDHGHPDTHKTRRQPLYRRALSMLLCMTMLLSNASSAMAGQTLTIPFGDENLVFDLDDETNAPSPDDTLTGVILPEETEGNDLEAQTDAESVSAAEETEADQAVSTDAEPVTGEESAYTEQTEAETDLAAIVETEPDTENIQDAETEADTENTEVREKREYTYDDPNVSVTVVLDDPETVPDDAELVVTPVTADSNYNYDAYAEALNAATPEDHSDEDFLLYDIALMVEKRDESGNPTGEFYEFQPADDTMHVNVTFKKNQLTNELNPDEPEQVEVIHLPLVDDVRESVDSTADASEITASDIAAESLSIDTTNVDLGGSTDSVDFVTESFSVFAFTVDFHYNGKDFSIAGGTQILLSTLIEKLPITREDGTPITIEEVKNVTSSDVELLQVNKVAGTISYKASNNSFHENEYVGEKNWLITSMNSFTTEEELTLELSDGTVIRVIVTDPAINSYEVVIKYVDSQGNPLTSDPTGMPSDYE